MSPEPWRSLGRDAPAVHPHLLGEQRCARSPIRLRVSSVESVEAGSRSRQEPSPTLNMQEKSQLDRRRAIRKESRMTTLSTHSWIALTCLLFMTQTALAGPNEGGTLILHANASIVYTTESQGYCTQSALMTCAEAVSEIPVESDVSVFHVIAAFPNGNAPRLVGITFGIEYDENVLSLADFGSCANFELPTEDWPAPGSGTALVWTAAETDSLIEVFWFAAYAYEDTTTFSLIEHPTQGASFADDSAPSELDPIVGFGRLGFGHSGFIPCPRPVVNQSWGYGAYKHCYAYSRTLRDAMRNAYLSGISIVCSAGNGFACSGSPCSTTPADTCTNYPEPPRI